LEPVSASLTGIHLDALKDWTRCFSLPKVVREKIKTWETDWFLLLGPGEKVDLEKLKALCNFAHRPQTGAEGLEVDRVEDPEPTEQEVHLMLYDSEGHFQPLVLNLMKKFRGQPLYEQLIYQHVRGRTPVALPNPGTRYPIMKKITGSLITYLLAWIPEEATPQLAFALLYDWVKAIKEKQTWEKEPTTLLWDLIKYAWERETARIEKVKLKKEDFLTQLVHKVEEWNTLDAFSIGTLGEKKAWVLSHLFLVNFSVGKCAVLNANGKYGYPDVPWKWKAVAAAAEKAGISSLVNFVEILGDKEVKISLDDIFDAHAQLFGEVVIDSTIEKCKLETAAYQPYTLITSPDRKFVPEKFDSKIQSWLKTFIPPTYWKLFCQWLKAAQKPELPLPALTLIGEAGAGKSMLAEAIRQFLGFSISASDEVLEDWKGALRYTSYIVLEEGILNNYYSMGKGARIFKGLLSGSRITANVKYGMPFQLQCLARIVINANDPDEILNGLIDKQTISDWNLAAINKRLFIVFVGQAATRFLEEKGNRKYTGDWITNKRLAMHLQALANRTVLPDNLRFNLDFSEELLDTQLNVIQDSVDDLEEFVEQLLKALVFYSKTPHRNLKWGHETIALTNSFLNDYFSKTNYKKVNFKKTSKQLKRIAVQQITRIKGIIGRWYFLDFKKIEKYANRIGVDLLEIWNKYREEP
jgi:hypothetical protein